MRIGRQKRHVKNEACRIARNIVAKIGSYKHGQTCDKLLIAQCEKCSTEGLLAPGSPYSTTLGVWNFDHVLSEQFPERIDNHEIDHVETHVRKGIREEANKHKDKCQSYRKQKGNRRLYVGYLITNLSKPIGVDLLPDQ